MAPTSARLVGLGLVFISLAAFFAYRFAAYNSPMPTPLILGWAAAICAIGGAKCLEVAINGKH